MTDPTQLQDPTQPQAQEPTAVDPAPATDKQGKKSSAQGKKSGGPPRGELGHLVRMKLHPSPEVPPGGLFVAVNGRSFLIPVGKEVAVPSAIVEVLRNAETMLPTVSESNIIEGYMTGNRFTYEVYGAVD